MGSASVGSSGERLRGWKEIGRFFGVDERTAKRWEATRGLPVHRLPGKPRAPVFAWPHELKLWAETGRTVEAPAPPGNAPGAWQQPSRRRLVVLLSLLLLLVAGVALLLWQGGLGARREAAMRDAQLVRLAGLQVEAINDRLDSRPGTLAVREALARESVEILGRAAALEGAGPELRRQAAEAYRRLAVLQNAIDRPSLRDRPAARASLDAALLLLEGQADPASARERARVGIEAANQAAGSGDVEGALRLLDAARPVALANPHGQLADEWWLAEAITLGWKGDYGGSIAAARKVTQGPTGDPAAALVRLRALDVEAEAGYYLGDLEAARTTYAHALAAAEAGAARWPTDNRFRWAVLRQQWNLGGTLAAGGRAREGAALLEETLAGWEALARADPSDEALGAWVRATRLSLGEALAESGAAAAVPVLSAAVAERRAWHAGEPGDADRRRSRLKAETALANALAAAGRAAEACLLYGEVEALAGTMATAGQLTGHDRRETLEPVRAARSRHCG